MRNQKHQFIPRIKLLFYSVSFILVMVFVFIFFFFYAQDHGYNPSRLRSKRYAQFYLVQTALDMYFQNNNVYPQSLTEIVGNNNYFPSLPNDPIDGTQPLYCVNPSRTKYYLSYGSGLDPRFPVVQTNSKGPIDCKKNDTVMTDNCLVLNMGMEKARFKFKEPILVKVVIKNTCDRSISAYTGFDYAISFEITDESGKQLRWLPFIPPPPITKDNFSEIKPYSQLTHKRMIISNDLYDKILPGHYNVSAIYKNINVGDKFDVNAWIGEIKSETISFEVLNQ